MVTGIKPTACRSYELLHCQYMANPRSRSITGAVFAVQWKGPSFDTRIYSRTGYLTVSFNLYCKELSSVLRSGSHEKKRMESVQL